MSKVWNYESKENDNLAKLVKDKGDDIVMTNPKMAIDLINNHTDFKEGDKVMEPCKGYGAFYDNLPDNINKVFCEINEGKDYLEYEGMVDITLSNPPFAPRKLFWSFMVKAMETTRRNIYWLINLSALNVFTPKRLDEMKEKKWYIQHLHIVADKRWFGRYVWVKIGRKNRGIFSWERKTY